MIDALAFPLKLPFHFTVTKILGSWAKPFIGRILVKQILKQIMYDSNKISEEQVEAYTFPFQMPGGKEAFIQTLQNFNQKELEDLSLHYQNIQVPILVIWGEKDVWIPISHFQRLSQTFPKAIKILISNCGHIPQEECPSEVSQAILKFL